MFKKRLPLNTSYYYQGKNFKTVLFFALLFSFKSKKKKMKAILLKNTFKKNIHKVFTCMPLPLRVATYFSFVFNTHIKSLNGGHINQW